jgi:4a-hydroxytetrahydrobiopterin dehydratase
VSQADDGDPKAVDLKRIGTALTARTDRLAPDLAKAMLVEWTAQTVPRDALLKTFTFPDFRRAIQWMIQVGVAAERLDHHPEWFNVYDRVEVCLTTHDAGGVTMLDVELASFMDAAALG